MHFLKLTNDVVSQELNDLVDIYLFDYIPEFLNHVLNGLFTNSLKVLQIHKMSSNNFYL